MRRAALRLGLGALLFFAATIFSSSAYSDPEEMNFSVHRSCNDAGRCTDVMMAEGYIDADADDRFRQFILPFATVTMVCLDSQGGDVGSAIRIAADIRTLGLSTCSFEEYRWPRSRLEPARCYSACSLVFMGGVHRVSGGEEKTPIGVHQFKFSSYVNRERTAGVIYQNLGYFIGQLGVDLEVLNIAAQIPVNEIYLLSIEEAMHYGVVTDVAGAPAKLAAP